MSPVALNINGQVVGTMGIGLPAGGPDTTPFFYTGGAVYDLSVVPNWPLGGVPVGINDWGQIVVNGANAVYLLTPEPLPSSPRWSIMVSHSGNYVQGQNGATFTINLTNSGTGVTTGIVTVTVPYGSTVMSISGTNWNCSGTACTRSDPLNAGAMYSPIVVTENIPANAPVTWNNEAVVWGGGAALVPASDIATVLSLQPQTPTAVSVNPVVSTGAMQTYVFQFSDRAGWQALSVVNVLINGSLDGRQACYLAYSVSNNILYLVPDNGTGLLPGLALNGAGSTSNSQCTVAGAGSSASGSGTTLTLTLAMTFASSFGGNKVVYLAARDPLNDSGWQTMGVHGVPPLPTTFPNPVSMSPSSGNTASATLTFTYQDASSASNLQTVWALINTALDGRSACYVAYYAPGNQVFLIPDNGAGSQAASMVLGSKSSLTNGQCTVFAQGSSAVQTGAQIAVTLNFNFNPVFGGQKVVWMAAQTLSGVTSAWQALGAWNVPL